MKKTLLVAAGLLSVSSLSLASGLQSQFYMGAQAGHMDTSLELSEVEANGDKSKLDGLAVSGFAGGVFAGLAVDIDDLSFVALEANYRGSDAAYEERDADDSLKIKARDGWGIAILGGLKPSEETKIYALLGYQDTKFQLKASDSGGSASASKNFSGVRVGGGGQSALTESVSLRLEWSQTFYSSEKEDGLKFQPTENLVQVGVLFNF